MREMNKVIVFLVFILFSTQVESKILSIGDAKAKVVIKVFSSLTCPHCASFHTSIFNNLKRDYIDIGLVRFEHHAFPLDLAALNAEIIVRCHPDNQKKFQILEKIYEEQKTWAVGSDINKINELIKKIGSDLNLADEKMDSCLKDDSAQEDILNQRIEAQKQYKIESTPTIFINEKKYTDKIDYSKFKSVIEKNL